MDTILPNGIAPALTKTVRMLSTEKGASDETLEKDSTYELTVASADYWLVRDKAELVEDNSKPPVTSRKVTSKLVETSKPATQPKVDADGFAIGDDGKQLLDAGGKPYKLPKS